jgi:hypothetical protein
VRSQTGSVLCTSSSTKLTKGEHGRENYTSAVFWCNNKRVIALTHTIEDWHEEIDLSGLREIVQ